MNMPADQSTIWLYFHSTVFQGNMALVAFLGVFVVFRLQQLQQQYQSHFENLVRLVRDSMTSNGQAIPVDCADSKAIENDINRIAGGGMRSHIYSSDIAGALKKDPRYDVSLRRCQLIEKHRQSLAPDLVKSILAIVLPTAMSILLLPNYSSLQACYVLVLVVEVALTIFALGVSLYFVVTAINREYRSPI
ncbi:MAG TPA: hypothetical protein VGL38_01365 [bacterium]|jgi:hypothetical protein